MVKYLRMGAHPAGVFDLGQSAVKRHAAGDSVHVPTICRQVHMLYSPEIKRWLIPKELLLLQGFPVTAAAKQRGEHSCYDEPRDTFPRERARVAHQAGNAMPVPMAGLSLLWSLAIPSP
eukprot:8825387-Pyramimonas_sp.AAC.1